MKTMDIDEIMECLVHFWCLHLTACQNGMQS